MRTAGIIVIAAGVLAGVCQAQVFSEVDFTDTAVEGFRLYGISAFSGYSTSALPTNYISNGVTPKLNWNVNYGATANVGWQRHRGEKTSISLLYGITYSGSTNYSGLNALNHTLRATFTRMLSSKWSLTIAGSGQDTTIAELIFQPSSLSALSQTPTSFNNLAAALSVGSFSDPQAASLLAGAPQNSAIASSLVGDRVLSYATTASIDYAATKRLSFHFGAVSAAGQNRAGNQTSGSTQPSTFTPRTFGLNGGVGLSYDLSPRTNIGVSLDALRSSNVYQTAYSTTGDVSIGRKMGEHWFARGAIGMSRNLPINQAAGTPLMQQAIGNASLGFQTHAQTFVGSYSRTGSDLFGYGIGTHTNSSVAWSWRRPGGNWSLSSSVGYQQMENTGFANFSGWSIATGLNEMLPLNLHLMAQYVYFHSNGTVLGTTATPGNTTSISVNSIRLTLGWVPQGVQAHRH
jgi:hypothetical protein